jgi:hypothetical protein
MWVRSPMRRQTLRCALLIVACVLLLVSCGSNKPVTFDLGLDAMGDKVAFVDQPFEMTITATDPDGDFLTFKYVSDIADLRSRASFTQDGVRARLQFTPRQGDIGIHPFDFTVDDGNGSSDTKAVFVDIRESKLQGGPRFVEPSQTGTVFDLSRSSTLTQAVIVDDQDVARVALRVEPPMFGTLTQNSDQSGVWTWTPTAEEIKATDRPVLTLSADDGINEVVYAYLLIVLIKPVNPSCPGASPAISHTPQDASSSLPLKITATVTDDKGIKGAPQLLYTDNASDTVADMTPVPMTQASGDSKNGTWTGEIPNPVTGEPTGTAADIYYVIMATDNDDPGTNCSHTTLAPSTGAYKMTVTNSGSGGLGLCEACTSDAQCGGPQDNCLPLGANHEGRCAKACVDDADCPTAQGYWCSRSDWTSLDGAVSRQCVPPGVVCSGAQACNDDLNEPDDNTQQARSLLIDQDYPSRSIDNVVCPNNEDWFGLHLAAHETVYATLAFAQSSAAQDLNVDFYQGGGSSPTPLSYCDEYNPSWCDAANGQSTTSNENFQWQVDTAGQYFIAVRGWNGSSNHYDICIAIQSGLCPQLSKS